MTMGPIPFVDAQMSGLEELGGASPSAMNVVVDVQGVCQQRPGIQADVDLFPTGVVDADGIDNIRVAQNGKTYVVGGISGGKRAVYLVTPGASTPLSLIADANTFVRGDRSRPTVAETAAMLVYAAGTFPAKLLLSDDSITKLPGGPPQFEFPPETTHVVGNSGRLIANNLEFPGSFNFSGIATGGAVAGNEDWGVGVGNGGFGSAESRPDPLIAVHENTNEVFFFGRTNVEVRAIDSSDPLNVGYAPLATREYGLIAPYSVIKRDQRFAWLDHKRRIVVSDGRSFEVISGPIQKTLDDMPEVSDCFGYWVREGVADCLVWTFPKDGRTFVFQEGLWGQWAGFDTNWKQLAINAHDKNTIDGQSIVGTKDGKLGKLTFDVQDDLGETINAYIKTGYIDRESSRLKQCLAVFVTLRRGEVTGDIAPEVFISFRDRPGPWRRLKLDLGKSNETNPVVVLRGLGTYRRRQWRFEFSGDEPLKLIRTEEQYEPMET